jgi:hypothetical protein
MEENKIKISYDISAEDAYDLVTGLLDKLGIKYEESGEETITIKYWIENQKNNVEQKDVRENLIDFINTQINYFSGGQQWKSLNEIVCDTKFVKVLEEMKNVIK